MKKIIFSLLTLCFTNLLSAQWTTSGSSIYYNGGNVGIGTTSPLAKLQLESGALQFYKTGPSLNNVDIIKIAENETNGFFLKGMFQGTGATGNGLKFSSLWEDNLLFLRGNGNVGIGKTDPEYALDITSSGADVSLRIDDGATGAPIRLRSANGGEAYMYMGNEASSIRRTGGDFRFWANGIDMSFSTNNGGTQHMFINTAGKVGIGTTSPSSLLHLDSESNTNLTVEAGPNLSSSLKLLEQGSGDVGAYLKYDGLNNRLGIFTGNNAPIERLSIVRDNGNVGIGISNPNNKLTVLPESRGNVGLSINDPSFPTLPRSYMGVTNDGAGYLELRSGPNIVVTKIAGSGYSYINGTNVGIGTTTPGEKLEVNGTIRSKKVKVEATGWPDYVFAPNYKLRALSEVEEFIKKNKHLPEVPSAKEVEKEGLDLGAMDATLLKKVEELTLYLIDMKKEVEGLKKVNKELSDEVKSLKSTFAKSSSQKLR